jgi:hypothetical protein
MSGVLVRGRPVRSSGEQADDDPRLTERRHDDVSVGTARQFELASPEVRARSEGGEYRSRVRDVAETFGVGHVDGSIVAAEVVGASSGADESRAVLEVTRRLASASCM